MTERLIQFYLARDLAGLFAWLVDQSAGDNQRIREIFEQKFVVARNATMVDRMAPRLREGKAFIAVGAAHLPGQRGILKMLAERGWQISRVY